MDRFDRLILEVMQSNGGLSVAEIAERVNLSKSACWRRIQKLEKDNVIRGKVTLLEPEKINLGLTVYISIRTNQHNDEWATNFKSVVQEIPEVVEVHRMSGDLDYLIKAMVSDMKDYDRLYKQIIKIDIFDVSSSFVMETMKQTTQLPLDRLTE